MKKLLTIFALFAITNCFSQASTSYGMIDDWTPVYANVFTDTITTPCLCEKALSCSGITIRNGGPYLQDVDFLGVEVVGKRVELTFEKKHNWQYMNIPGYDKENGTLIRVRYLDPVEGCYQLTPLNPK
jgi:hypothetical protein